MKVYTWLLQRGRSSSRRHLVANSQKRSRAATCTALQQAMHAAEEAIVPAMAQVCKDSATSKEADHTARETSHA